MSSSVITIRKIKKIIVTRSLALENTSVTKDESCFQKSYMEFYDIEAVNGIKGFFFF